LATCNVAVACHGLGEPTCQPAAYCRFDISARLGSEHHEFAAATTMEGIGIAVANPPNLVEYLEGMQQENFSQAFSLRQILDDIISEAKLWYV
jgi:hypothetical protein